MANHSFHDFSELASLKASLSQEETLKAQEMTLRKGREVKNSPPKEKPVVWPIVFEFESYLDAVASAVKNYPIIWAYDNGVIYQNRKNGIIYRVGKGDNQSLVFYYTIQAHRRVFKCTERFTAFKVIMFCFAELKKIEPIHIKVTEGIASGNFVLSLDEIPVVAASYMQFNGLKKQLVGFRDSLCSGHQIPRTDYEMEAHRFGVDLAKRIDEAKFLEKIPLTNDVDYSKFYHIESVLVSSRENTVTGKYSYGNKSSGPSMLSSMMNWDDRYDHDD